MRLGFAVLARGRSVAGRGACPLPGSPKPGADSFLDHRPLELREYAHHLKHGLAGWRHGVQALLVQEKVNAKRVQLGEESD
jgi:hypothetical protein